MSKAQEILNRHLNSPESAKKSVLNAMQEYAAFCCGLQRTVCFMVYKDSGDKHSIITAELPLIVTEKL